MEGKTPYAWVVLALLAGFSLFCAGGFFAQTGQSEPWLVNTAQRPIEVDRESMEGVTSAGLSAEEEAYYPESLLPGEVIDINKADIYDLQRLPGIGEKRAGDIIAWREEHGPFQTMDDLTQVPGIGPVTLDGLRAYAVTGNE